MPYRFRIVHFSPWADRLEDANVFVNRLPGLNLDPLVTNPADDNLMRMARLDCDWHGENTRVFAAMKHPMLEFLPAQVTGINGLLDLAKSSHPGDERHWLVFDGQAPQKIDPVIDRIMPLMKRAGIQTAWYSFDESSRTTTAFRKFAPHLDLLIHDESPLDPEGQALLRPGCLTLHRSWVANLIPFSVPFNESPDEKILFLGSKLGMTENRQRQINALKQYFGSRFVAINDHSISVATRAELNRFKVALCPEGRKFGTPAMSKTHTDRPFWSGCLGLVPVSENSRAGDRLESLAARQLIQRYAYGNLPELKAACDGGLNTNTADRRKIYDHFNLNETVGTVMAEALSTAVK